MRSLRARLLVATMAVAVGAVLATAWLTTRASSERLRDSVERTLETDGDIYGALVDHAMTHTDWDEVEGLVADLSDETGRRIALTTPKGDVIADSARIQGRHVRLPDRPAAVVDPFDPLLILGSDTASVAGMTESNYVVYEFEPDERAEREALLVEAVGCLRDRGYRADGRFEEGYPYLEILDEPADSAAELAAEQALVDCSDPRLDAPPRAEVAATDRMAEVESACLDAAGVEHRIERQEHYGAMVVLPEEASAEDYTAEERCFGEADRTVYGADTAPIAHLYLGEPGRQGVTLAEGERGRTLAAVGGVVVLALAVTLLASRRVLRPVAALTAAAGRLEAGDRDQRVDEGGGDELAGLARAFNRMADALAGHERQRRRLASDVAHELRTPLANLRGYVEAAQDGVTPADPALLASLHEEALLLQRLVDDLQILSLAEAGRLPLTKRPTDLVALAAQVVDSFRLAAEAAGVTLTAVGPTSPDAADGPVVVRRDVDPQRARQILVNLVSNALRHTPAGGTVTVAVAADGTVTVADTGEGIDPEHLAHVFDRFWRADASRARDTGGSGLGLAICRQLAELHGGTLAAESAPGRGATFTLLLPNGP